MLMFPRTQVGRGHQDTLHYHEQPLLTALCSVYRLDEQGRRSISSINSHVFRPLSPKELKNRLAFWSFMMYEELSIKVCRMLPTGISAIRVKLRLPMSKETTVPTETATSGGLQNEAVRSSYNWLSASPIIG